MWQHIIKTPTLIIQFISWMAMFMKHVKCKCKNTIWQMLRGELDSCLFFGVPIMTQDEDNYIHKNICNISRISKWKSATLYVWRIFIKCEIWNEFGKCKMWILLKLQYVWYEYCVLLYLLSLCWKYEIEALYTTNQSHNKHHMNFEHTHKEWILSFHLASLCNSGVIQLVKNNLR